MKDRSFVIISILVAAVLAFGGFFVGSHTGIDINVKVENVGGSTPVVTPTAQPTVAPTTQPTTAPTTAPTQPAAPADTTAPAAPADTTAPAAPASDAPAPSGNVPSTPDEVVAKFNEVLNATKHEAGSVTVRKVESIDMQLTDCSISAAVSLLNPIIQKFITDSDDTFTFNGGVAQKDDGGTKELNSFVGPGGRDACLNVAAVQSATCVDNGNGTYTIDIALNQETSTFDGTNTVNPVNHESVMDPLNLATLDISPAKITSATMTYPGLTVKATYNANGTIDNMELTCPMKGDGSGGISFFNVDLTIEGKLVDTFTFTR